MKIYIGFDPSVADKKYFDDLDKKTDIHLNQFKLCIEHLEKKNRKRALTSIVKDDI